MVARETGNRQWEGNALSNLGLLRQTQGYLPDARVKLEASLICARETGYARLEAIVLCNLGIVKEAMGEADDALASYEAALSVARDLGDLRSEGQFLGYVGTLHARQGRFDTARLHLDAGAHVLRGTLDHFNLGVLLCGRAEMEFLSGARELIFPTLAEAEVIANQVGAGPGSDLASALERVRALVTNSMAS
jgi:tetratricopeptide (TPR) repeat protein